MIETVAYITVFFVSLIGVELLRRWIVRKDILDIPNERSSHSTPTPRGGGLVIVAVSLSAYFFASLFFPIGFNWWFFLAALLIAAISWLDDIVNIGFGWRFLVHAAAAVIIIFGVGFWREIYFPYFGVVDFGVFGAFFSFCWIVWMTNAFNFMDGIDGIAGLQAVTAGIGWLIIGKMLQMPETSILGGILAFSSLGFLIHNWEPAKIFMGDVGSAFLGFSFAAIPLLSEPGTQPKMPWITVLLVVCFFIDSIVTFFKRLFKGEKVWQPHREHFYQKLVIKGRTHRIVSLVYGAVSTFFILLIVWAIY